MYHRVKSPRAPWPDYRRPSSSATASTPETVRLQSVRHSLPHSGAARPSPTDSPSKRTPNYCALSVHTSEEGRMCNRRRFYFCHMLSGTAPRAQASARPRDDLGARTRVTSPTALRWACRVVGRGVWSAEDGAVSHLACEVSPALACHVRVPGTESHGRFACHSFGITVGES